MSLEVEKLSAGGGGGGETKTWGASLPVESVQELVRKDPSNIPERYVRTSNDRTLPHLSSQIPVIDLSMLCNGDEEQLDMLDMACKDWGFFQIINHGIPTEVLRKAKSTADEFFELPLEHKKKHAMPPDDIQGYGQLHVVSEQQKLNWADVLLLLIYPTNFRNPRYWPSIPPDFDEAIEMYSLGVNEVAKKILASLSLLMRLEKEYLWNLHNETMQALRVNYYPTCSEPTKVMGVSPHSDYSTITVLLQDDGVTGLEIRHRGGWVPVEPIPNALVLNVGDVLEIWSNGRYKSVEHRAMTNKSKSRISMASFISPSNDVLMEPLRSVTAWQRQAPRYKRITFGEYLRYNLNKEENGKSHLQLIKLEEEEEEAAAAAAAAAE